MKYFLLILLSTFLLQNAGLAQQEPPADSKGKDFWFTFPPNYHNNYNNSWYKDDLLYIFIAADEQTTAELQYTDMDGIQYQQTVNITNPDIIEIIALPYRGFELEGWNQSGTVLPSLSSANKNETVVPASFRVVSEEEVSVYIQNQAKTTSDATLVYPVDALGKNYFVMSYTVGLRNNVSQSTPSQFAIVATEDDTKIDITPPKGNPTEKHGDSPFSVTLNRGESYLVQSKPTNNFYYDLTGTHILSSKPIAVFGSHQRAQVPMSEKVENPSRDYLLQQIIPIESWHKSAFVIPFKTVSNGVPNKDLVRVLSASGNNKIYRDGNLVMTLNRGEFLELEINKAIHLTSSAPMQVATYAKTTQTQSNSKIGDPLMMLIHPKEQFYKEYKFINTQTQESSSNVYSNQYVAVILPSSGKSSLTLDGNPVSTVGYLPIPDSDYEYKIIETSDGVHTISCDEDIAIYVYGYGAANSYGYIGGMNFKIFDHKDPVVSNITHCFRADFAVSDTLDYDLGIEYFNIESSNNANYDVNQSELPEIVRFSAELVDPLIDGSITYTVRDSMGFGYTKTTGIPGFTVSFESYTDGAAMPERGNIESKLLKRNCLEVTLENYGSFPQYITDAYLKNSSAQVEIQNANLPITIEPGTTKTIDFCIYSDKPGEVRDTILITNNCIDREIEAVSFTFIPDTEAPKAFLQGNDCNDIVYLTATDTTEFDLGVREVIYEEMNNISLIQESKSPYYTSEMRVNERRLKAWYRVKIIDIYGNETIISDTLFPVALRVQGTIETNPERDEQYIGEYKVGTVSKYPIIIENYGSRDQVLTYAHAIKNRHFSVPRGQFPLTVPANSTAELIVVYHPDFVQTEKYRDTILFAANCFEDYIPLAADAKPIEFDAMTQCDLSVSITANGVPFELYVSQPTPMPSGETASIRYRSNFSNNVKYNLYTNNGSLVKSGNLHISEGNGSLDIPLHELGNGQYLLKINNDIINESFVIIKNR